VKFDECVNAAPTFAHGCGDAMMPVNDQPTAPYVLRVGHDDDGRRLPAIAQHLPVRVDRLGRHELLKLSSAIVTLMAYLINHSHLPAASLGRD
jgi:hypothetical protein